MNSRDAPTFEFADSSPVRPGRKLRRGRGNATNSRKTPSAAGTGSATIAQAATSTSFRQGGHKISSVASNLSDDLQSQTHHYLHQQPHAQANYYTSDAWDNVGSPKGGINTIKDDNSCTGSLTYSASSSVQSAESSNDSSFADIIKLIDSSEGDGTSDINKVIAKNSKPASSSGASDSLGKQTAVSGWMQGVDVRRRSPQKAKEKEPKKKVKKNLFTMSPSKHKPSNSNVDLNYSKDDSSEDDVFGVDLDEKILETIAGHDDDIARTFVTSQSDPILKHEEYEVLSSMTTPTISTPSTPRTPPPNSRSKRTSSPPGEKTIPRTNSRQSKSSSDGSFDTPAPSSPPNSTKPPHAARSVFVSKSRGKARKEDENVVEDLSEAFYAKSWMCGFADAFNF